MDMASILASNLKENEPCPVCGSIHHINLAKEINIKELDTLRQEYNNIQKELDNIKLEENKKNVFLISIKKKKR